MKTIPALLTLGFDWLRAKLTPPRFYPLLLALLVLAGFAPLLLPGMPAGHDLYYHLSRLNAMIQGLRGGEFPILINHGALNGYGYASGLFYPDLFFYPAALFGLCGMGIVAAYKLLMVLWGLFIAFSAYFTVRRLTHNSFAAFAGGLLYCWSSYLAVDFFIRAAVGEWLAFPFVPLILLGLYEVFYGDWKKFYPLALGFTGVALTHNLTLLVMTLVVAFYTLFQLPRLLEQPRRIVALCQAAIVTGLLSLFYIAPLLEQLLTEKFILSSVMTGANDNVIANRTVPFLRLFLEVPYMRLAYWIPSGIGLILIAVNLQRLRFVSGGSATGKFRDTCLIAGLLSLLAATEFLPWEGFMRVLSVLQFPWRFYLPATAFLAIGGALSIAAITHEDPGRTRRWCWIIIVGAGSAWWINTGYLYAAKIHEKNIIYSFIPGAKQEASGLCYLAAGSDVEAFSRRGDVALPWLPNRTLRLNVRRPAAHMLTVDFHGNDLRSNWIELPLSYYRGYQAVMADTGRELTLTKSANALLSVELPADVTAGNVIVTYPGTLLKSLTAWISLLTALLLALRLLIRRPDTGRRA